MNSVVFNKMELVGAIKQFAPFPHQVFEIIEIGVKIGENKVFKIVSGCKNSSFVSGERFPIAIEETVDNVKEFLGVIAWVVLMVKLIASSTTRSLPGKANVHEDPEERLHVKDGRVRDGFVRFP